MTYSVTQTSLAEVLILEPKVFRDDRGVFFESFNQRDFQRCTGLDVQFVQDNHSISCYGVLRGLHYQIQHPQGKLVRVVQGRVLDVAVDLRRSSPTFGKWTSAILSQFNCHQMWIPPGFAHGFFVLSETAEFLYKTTDYRYAEHERTLAWNDPAVGIDWDICDVNPIMSEKDKVGASLERAEVYE